MAEAMTCYASPSDTAEVYWAKRFKKLVDEMGLKEGLSVRYIPTHAKGDIKHPDCEDGVVSSIVERWDGGTVFVRYYSGERLKDTPQATEIGMLRVLNES